MRRQRQTPDRECRTVHSLTSTNHCLSLSTDGRKRISGTFSSMTRAWDTRSHASKLIIFWQQQRIQHQRPQIAIHFYSSHWPSVILMAYFRYTTSPLTHTLQPVFVSPYHVHAVPYYHIQTLLPGIVHLFALLYHHHVVRLEYIFPARNSARRRTKFFGRNFAWFNLGLGQRSRLLQFLLKLFFACFLKERVVFRIFVWYWVFCSILFLQIWRKINLRTTLSCRHLRTLQLVTSHSFQPTTLRSHLPPNHTYNPILGPYHLSLKISHQTSHPHTTLASWNHGSITENQAHQPALVVIPAW